MTLHNIEDIEEFSKIIESCKGRVELVSKEGDHLNLKSKLSQYVALAPLFASDMITELELEVEDDEDKEKIYKFMIGTTINNLPFA